MAPPHRLAGWEPAARCFHARASAKTIPINIAFARLSSIFLPRFPWVQTLQVAAVACLKGAPARDHVAANHAAFYDNGPQPARPQTFQITRISPSSVNVTQGKADPADRPAKPSRESRAKSRPAARAMASSTIRCSRLASQPRSLFAPASSLLRSRSSLSKRASREA